MAINPNTDFTAGQVLTSSQANRFPRGVVAFAENITPSGVVAVETLTATTASFTAVANRYYRISYIEPIMQYFSGTVNAVGLRLRLTNITGTILQLAEIKMQSTTPASGIVQVTTTLTAGSTVIVGTFAPFGGGSSNNFRSSTARAQVLVEDIGPA